MIGAALTLRSNPTVQIPTQNNPTADILSPFSNNADYVHYLTALHRYLPSNESLLWSDSARVTSDEESDSFLSDEFRMYEFKVKRCPRGRSHDWTECPYAHPGEKARRRDLRRYHYCGVPCIEFRKGGCKKGDSCEFAHGVFECWLHPSRYRTQPCKDGRNCPRRVCFFAHTPDQLRTIPAHQHSYQTNTPQHVVSSPTSILASHSLSSPCESPPSSPQVGEFMDLIASMRQMNMASSSSPRVRPVFSQWGLGVVSEEEPVMERVESGRDLRARMYAKLSKENSFDRVGSDPDVEWVSKLII